MPSPEQDPPSGEPASRTLASRGARPGQHSAHDPAGADGRTDAVEVSRSGTHALTRLSAGQLIAGRFEVRGVAGAGGMGVVYRAVDTNSGADVALKLLLNDAVSSERFLREALVLADFRHPAIVSCIAHGIDQADRAYIAMEWLDGVDLATHLRDRRLSVAESIALAVRLSEALAFAHQRGIVHRDINPKNIFLVGAQIDQLKVLDFGIAQLSSSGRRLTQGQAPIGTPGYMAPEQAQNAGPVSASADVFCVGCVLYECLTGQRAFVGHTLLELLAKILVDKVPRPSTLNPSVSKALDELVLNLLAKDPRARPQHGAELLLRLRGLDLSETRDGQDSAPLSLGLTNNEQRVLGVVLAAAPPASELRDPASEIQRARLAAAVAPFDARLEHLADGSVMAVLSGHGNASDLTARAAHCALAVQHSLNNPLISLAIGRGLADHSGRSQLSGSHAAGEAVERASRLLRLSRKPQDAYPILVDDVAASLLDARFELRTTPAGTVLRGLCTTSEPARTVLGTPTTFVGRERELLVLDATYRECASEGTAHVVLVTAASGVGKSRLAREFTRSLRRQEPAPQLWLTKADVMSRGTPFGLLSEAIRRSAGILEGEPSFQQRQKLHSKLAAHVPRAELQRISEFIGELVGVHFPDADSAQLRAARHDAVLRGDQMLRAFEDWLRFECQAQPVVVIIDDLQWGDLSSIKFIDAALRTLKESSLLVVALARPEVHELFPELWARRGLFELRLNELKAKACERIVREVLGTPNDATLRRLTERSGGNPLWLEELLRVEANGALGNTPESVLLLAQARLEQLSAEQRRLLRAAAIFGQRFWLHGVLKLLEGEPSSDAVLAQLKALEDIEIIVGRSVGRFPGEPEFEFRNEVFRDAAYATLTAADRISGHGLAAEWLEASGESNALALAEHFDRGGNLARAARSYQRAAEQALEGNDYAGAAARAERGLSAEPKGELKAALHLTQTEARKWRGENLLAQKAALAAMDSAEVGSPQWCQASSEAIVASGKLGELACFESLARALLECQLTEVNEAPLLAALSRAATQLVFAGATDLADALLARIETLTRQLNPAAATVGWVLEARAARAGSRGDPSARRRLAELAALQFEQAGDRRNACLQRISIGYACVELGDHAEAEVALREALQTADRLEMSNSVPIAKAQLGRALARRGKVAEAIELLTHATRAFDEQNNRRLGGVARVYLAELLLLTDQLNQAEAVAREAVARLATSPAALATAQATLAAVLLRIGQPAAALELARGAAATLGEHRSPTRNDTLIAIVLTEALRASGDLAGAQAAATEACRHLLARADLIQIPADRERFLNAVPENTQLLSLARALEQPSPERRADAPIIA